MICQKCGAVIKDTMKFCNRCGARNVAPIANTIESEMMLPNEEGSTFQKRTSISSENKKQEHPMINHDIDKGMIHASGEKVVQACASHAAEMGNLAGSVKTGTPAVSKTHTPTDVEEPVQKKESKSNILETKSKLLAGLLGLFLGIFGVQWFYLGNKTRGWIYLGIFFITGLFITPLYTVFVYLCMAEGLYLLCSTKKGFSKYVNLI